MNDLPYVGCAITIIDPGPVSQKRNTIYTPRRRRNGELRLMKVFVERIESRGLKGITSVHWRTGNREGDVRPEDEGVEWVRGHGPMARAALLATRKLVHS